MRTAAREKSSETGKIIAIRPFRPLSIARPTHAMARRKPTGFYDTIEYIGPRPEKPKRPNVAGILGGWLILVIAGGVAFWFGRPLASYVMAAQAGVSVEQADRLISSLESTGLPGDRLAAAAIIHSREPVRYDSAVFKIDYPGGDVPADRGNGPDVIVRVYRQIGVDLQKEIHEDMSEHFRLYPQLWGAAAPDPNIDHRRVANLQRFFSRHGQELPVSRTRNPADFEPGDVVVWALSNGQTHVGIVVPGAGPHGGQPWVVHNLDTGIKWENALFEYNIIGHYRYPVPDAATVADDA